MSWFISRRSVAAVSLTLLCGLASAQAFPSRPIHIVVPFSAGGGTDVLTRIVAQQLSEQLKQQVLVENRPGAGGSVAGAAVAKAPADGHTLYVGTNAASMMPALYRNLSFDPVNDFKPVALIGTSPFLLVVNKQVPANSLQELLALARAKPGSLTYGSAGNGSVNHVGMELLKSATDTRILHIPYKGSSAALADVIGGQLTMMLDTVVSATPHVKSGAVRALAATSLKRSSLAPDVPSADEQGVKGFDVSAWYGFVAPKGTPDEIVQKLNAEVAKAIASPAVRQRYATLGAEPVSLSVDEFGRMWVAEEKKWSEAIRTANIRLE